jgi:hypothetical protein
MNFVQQDVKVICRPHMNVKIIFSESTGTGKKKFHELSQKKLQDRK